MAEQTLETVLVSPEKILWQGEATMITLPAAEGEAGLRIGHAPYLALLRAGPLWLETPSGAREKFVIFGGFVETDGKKAVLLAEEALPFEALDRDVITRELAEAKEELSMNGNDGEAGARKKLAEEKIKRAEIKLNALARLAG